jgi:hypothetical protein
MTSDTQKRRAVLAVGSGEDARPAYLRTTRELAVAHTLSSAFFAEGDRLEAQLLADARADDDDDYDDSPLDPWPAATARVHRRRWPLAVVLGIGVAVAVAAACLWMG